MEQFEQYSETMLAVAVVVFGLGLAYLVVSSIVSLMNSPKDEGN